MLRAAAHGLVALQHGVRGDREVLQRRVRRVEPAEPGGLPGADQLAPDLVVRDLRHDHPHAPRHEAAHPRGAGLALLGELRIGCEPQRPRVEHDRRHRRRRTERPPSASAVLRASYVSRWSSSSPIPPSESRISRGLADATGIGARSGRPPPRGSPPGAGRGAWPPRRRARRRSRAGSGRWSCSWVLVGRCRLLDHRPKGRSNRIRPSAAAGSREVSSEALRVRRVLCGPTSSLVASGDEPTATSAAAQSRREPTTRAAR